MGSRRLRALSLCVTTVQGLCPRHVLGRAKGSSSKDLQQPHLVPAAKVALPTQLRCHPRSKARGIPPNGTCVAQVSHAG